MSEFIVSALKYRPGSFEDVVGQEDITQTLENAVKNDQLAQAYLFCGPRGVGKTTCARILAKVINNTENDPEYDHSFNIFELDAASNNSVDDIRMLVDQVRIPPTKGNYKVYIIDEVHMLSKSAFNAFLKTLEEPPPYAKFVLATTEKQKVLPTIISRCQVFDFKRITTDDMVKHLKKIADAEGIKYEEEALHIIATKADGALRDALSIFDRQVSFSDRNLTRESVLHNLNILDKEYYFSLTDSILVSDHAAVLNSLNEILEKGFQGDDVLAGLGEHFRNLLVAKDTGTAHLITSIGRWRDKYLEQGQLASAGFLITAMNLANKAEIAYRSSKNQRLTVELALIKMCYIGNSAPLEIGTTAPKAATSKPIPEKKTAEPVVAKPKEATPPKAEEKTPEPSIEPEPEPVQAKEEIPAPVKEEPKPQEPVNEGPELKIPVMGEDKLGSLEDLAKQVKGMKADAEEEEASNTSAPDLDKLNQLWIKYSEETLDESKVAQKTAMHASVLSLLDNNTIEAALPNGVQVTMLEEIKYEIADHIRQEMNLVKLNLVLKHDEQLTEDQPRKPYTAREKYDDMVKKNPNLEKLSNQLGLDFEH